MARQPIIADTGITNASPSPSHKLTELMYGFLACRSTLTASAACPSTYRFWAFPVQRRHDRYGLQESTVVRVSHYTIGLTLLAINFFATGRDELGAVCFVLSLGFKQMALYYAPAIGSYLLAKCLCVAPKDRYVCSMVSGTHTQPRYDEGCSYFSELLWSQWHPSPSSFCHSCPPSPLYRASLIR